VNLEAQLGKEVADAESLLLVLGRLVPVLLLEELLERLLGLLPAFAGCEGRVVEELLEVKVDRVAGGHNVVEVDGLDEGLDLSPLLNLGRLHVLDDAPGVPVDACHSRVSEPLVLVALIRSLDNHGLAAREAARQDNHNLAALEAVRSEVNR
jgi:hypothetical protein